MSNARTIADLAAVTATATELNALDGITSNVTELNLLDGVTATTAEINYVDGVTSNVQTQIDSKVGSTHTGDVDITGELLVDSYNETFKKVSSVGAVTGYQFANIAYDSVSLSYSALSNNAVDTLFNNDGTKLYVLIGQTRVAHQYTLSTAYDLSTASSDSVSFDFSSQDTGMGGITFNNNGTKLYAVGYTNDAVYQYSLSTAYDLSSISYDSVNVSVASQDNLPSKIKFNNDGTSLYVIGISNTTIFQYNLTSAYDLSTASYASKSFSVATQASSGRCFVFNGDGTKLYAAGSTNDTIYQYSLSTAFDISTASYDSVSFSVASQASFPTALTFNSNGTKLYVTDNTSTTLYQYSTSATTYSTTFDCENANVFETELDANTTVVFSNPPASGTPVVTGYQLSSAAYASKSFSVTSQETAPRAVEFKTDGTKMYVVGSTSDTVFQYALSTAWDVSTASYESKSFSVATEQTVPDGIRFKPDGTKFYILGDTPDSVHQYSMSTAWDISTASYDSVTFSVGSQTTQAHGIVFKPDGTKFYVCDNTNDSVFQYALSTAWDLNTASYESKSFSVTSQETSPSGLNFNTDGTKMWVIGFGTDSIYQYSLSTAWDVSTASYDSVSFSVSTQTGTPYDFTFGDSGTKFYVVEVTNDTVYQYDWSTSTLNDSTAYAMSLKVVQDSGASGYTVTWPTSVDWPSATAPTLTATASAVDQFVFYTYDGGTTWYGFTAGQALG